MRQQSVHDVPVPVDDVEDSGGQTSLGKQLAEPDGRERHLLGRFQDERVAAGECDRDHPERDHHRKVERRDPDANADRVADRLAIHLAGDVR